MTFPPRAKIHARRLLELVKEGKTYAEAARIIGLSPLACGVLEHVMRDEDGVLDELFDAQDAEEYGGTPPGSYEALQYACGRFVEESGGAVLVFSTPNEVGVMKNLAAFHNLSPSWCFESGSLHLKRKRRS
jgi:hypothetical protein